jgi:hypothetical protein
MMPGKKTLHLMLALLFAFGMCSGQVTSSIEQTNTRAARKTAEIYLGGNIEELVHIGISFGEKTALGGSVGYYPAFFSTGINLKTHFSSKQSKKSYSTLYLRFASGYRINYGIYWETGPIGGPPSSWEREKMPPDMLYLSAAFGNEFFPRKMLRLNLEGGIRTVLNNRSNYYNHLAPTISFRIVLKIIKEHS